MTEQLQLLTVPATRTEFVLNAIRAAGEDGLHPDEIGALIHSYDRVHASTERCEWCGKDGVHLLKKLNRDRLVTRRHGNAAVAVRPAVEHPESRISVPYGEFPEGF